MANRSARDMPPPGGFETLKYKRNLPFRGPSGVMMLLGVTAISAFGFYRLGKGNLERRCVLWFLQSRVLSLFSVQKPSRSPVTCANVHTESEREPMSVLG